jgi:hypothetical protein
MKVLAQKDSGRAATLLSWNNSQRLVSLWEIVNNIDIEHLVTALRQLSYASAAFMHHQERLHVMAISPVCIALGKCVEPFKAMGFKTSWGMIVKFLDAAGRNMPDGDWTGQQFSEKCHAVFSAIQCETIGVMCLKLDADNAQYFDKKTPYGDYVSAGFPQCTEDISEAHQCFAVERYTASMFHLGRAMEIVVKVVAKKLRVRPARDEWQAYLSALNEKIHKMPFKTAAQKKKRIPLAELAGHLFNFKEAWRNPTFHAKKTYTRDEALAVLTNAGAFMDGVARNILKVRI